MQQALKKDKQTLLMLGCSKTLHRALMGQLRRMIWL